METIDFNDCAITFWHSDENRPFLRVEEVRKITIDEDGYIDVYNQDYTHPIITVHEYDYWKEV